MATVNAGFGSENGVNPFDGRIISGEINDKTKLEGENLEGELSEMMVGAEEEIGRIIEEGLNGRDSFSSKNEARTTLDNLKDYLNGLVLDEGMKKFVQETNSRN